jgi:hypothetical protein
MKFKKKLIINNTITTTNIIIKITIRYIRKINLGLKFKCTENNNMLVSVTVVSFGVGEGEC